MTKDSEWAARLVREKHATQETERLRTEKTLSDRKLVAAGAASAWSRLGQRIEELAAELNKAMGQECLLVERPSANVLTLRAGPSGHDADSLTFNSVETTLRVNFYGAELRLAVGPNDQLVWESTAESKRYWSNDQAAQQAIERAWQSFQ